MYPYIEFLSMEIGTYGVFCVLGGALAFLLALLNRRHSGLDFYDVAEAAAAVIVGAVVGAKVLYLIVDFDTVQHIIREHGMNRETLMDLMQGGFVFYGGFLGGLLALFIYAGLMKMPLQLYLMTIAPGIPLAHAFGRVGCFMAGCCYGIPSEVCGIAFENALGAPNGIKLFPVQLLESALLLVLAVIMEIYYMRSKRHHCVIYLYLFLYPVIRLITEQFRYDDAQRGIFLGLSTSTWISIGIMIVGSILFLMDWRKGFPEPELPEYEE
ncbi:MAG: prolipoprotein diacylglyceryl transferase [Ruminococcus sp.]|nr:prolipoprotein diacylglyceryl transferase [Ruminococcus sp.]